MPLDYQCLAHSKFQYKLAITTAAMTIAITCTKMNGNKISQRSKGVLLRVWTLSQEQWEVIERF